MSGPFYNEGNYVCRVTGQSLTTTTNGNVQFVLNFIVLGVPDPANPDNYLASSRQLARSWYCALTEKTVEYALEDLRLIGFPPGKSFGRLDPKDSGCHHFRDQVVDMYCQHEDDQNGNPRERWRVSRKKAPAARPAVKPESIAALDAIASRKIGGAK